MRETEEEANDDFFFWGGKEGEESKIRKCKWWASYAMDTPARLHQAAPWQTCVATVECAHEKKRSSSFLPLLCWLALRLTMRRQGLRQGFAEQNSVAKFGFCEEGIEQSGEVCEKESAQS